MALSVIGTQSGVNSPQDDRNTGKVFPQEPYGLQDPWIPVGHGRGNQGQVGARKFMKVSPGHLRWNSIPAVFSRDGPKGFGLGNDLFEDVPPAILFSLRGFQGASQLFGKEGEIQAIEEGNPETLGPKNTAEVKQPQGFHPEVVGGKVMDPGIYEKDALFP